MVIDPLFIIYFKMYVGAVIDIHVALSSCWKPLILPVPSMCPLTICPPKRSPNFKDLSKLTLLPGDRLPRLLLRMVSAITSTSKPLEVKDVIVKHTPFVAILSPNLASSNTFLALIEMVADLGPFF